MEKQRPKSAAAAPGPTRLALSKDRNTVTMVMPLTIEGRTYNSTLDMDSDFVDKLLQGLGSLRAKMVVEHPPQFPEGVRIKAISESKHRVWLERMKDRPMWSVRHPS